MVFLSDNFCVKPLTSGTTFGHGFWDQWVSSVRAVVECESSGRGHKSDTWCMVFVAVTIHAVADDPLGETDCSTNAMQMQYLCNCYPYIYSFRENSCRVNPQSRQTRPPTGCLYKLSQIYLV